MKPGPEKRACSFLLLCFTVAGIWSGEALAAAKYSRASAGWNANSTWSTAGCGGAANTTVPGAADDVTICTGHTITTSANSSALSLLIQTGGTLTQATNRTLTIGSTLNVAGLFTCQNLLTVTGTTMVSGTLTIANVNGAKTLTGDVTVSAGGTWNETVAEAISFGGSLANNGTFTASTGVHTFTGAGKTFSGNPITIPAVAVTGSYTNTTTLTVATALSGAGSLTNGANQTLNLGGGTTVTNLIASASPNTVNYTANAAQTVKSTTYYHLTKSGTGTATAGGNLTVNGTLTVSSGTLALAATTSQFNGPTNVTGTLSMTTATKTFVGAVTVNAFGVWTSSATGTSIFGSGITHNGTTFTGGIGQFNTSSQALAGSSAMTFAGAVTVTGAITLTNSNSNTARINGNLNGSAAGSIFVNGTNATLDYRGANVPMATGVLTANANPNTVIYARAGNQTIKLPSAGYHHLTTLTSGTKTAPAGTLAVAGNLTINTGTTFTANANDPVINVTGNATIDGTYTASNQAAKPLTIGGNISVAGTYTGNTAPVNLGGNFTRTGTFTSGSGVFTFNGSALQTLTGATTFTSLTVNNSGTGLSLTSDITTTTAAAGTLVLTAGTIATGSNNLIVSRSCTTPSVTRTGGWVAGNLRLAFPTGAPACTFQVGDASNYRPIVMTFASVTTAGSLAGTVSQSAGEHPNIATSGLDSAKDVNRYWTLTNPGGIAFTTYTATFNFINPGDIDSGATPTSFEIERWNGAWNTTTLGTAGATSTSASSLPTFGAGVSNSFALGQKKPPTVVSINRASTDPATSGTSVDWTVTFSSSVTGVDSTDFTLVMGGGLSGASITGVSGSGTTWTVTANTGTGTGTLGLNLVDDDTITASGIPLGGVGAGNGNFTGQVYTVVATISGFIFTDSVCVHNITIGAPGQTCALIGWSPQVAGQALSGVYITAVNTLGVPTRLHASAVSTRNMEFGLSCHNPIANAGVQATFAGVTLPLCQGSGATPTTWSSTVNVTFPGGSPSSNTSYSFNYADVGSVELWMRNNATPTQTGSSPPFVVKPYGFTVSVAANPAAADATGAAFVKAGASFTATVTAVANGGAITPNYGKESTAEGVLLTAALVPGLGLTNVPALSNGTIVGSEFGSGGMVNDANGIATVTNLAWTEVGIIRLTPSVADASYLGMGDVIGTVSANVGRFYPDHFTLSSGSGSISTRSDVSPACSPVSAFTYMNEPFKAGFTMKATGPPPGNVTLLNYASSVTPANNFAKLATGTPIPAGFGFAYLNVTTNLSSRIDSSLGITGDWTAGELTATATLGFTRNTAPDGPYDTLKVGIAPADSDGVTLSVLNMDVTAPAGNDHTEVGQTQIRFGRLRLLNAYGSELLPLRVPVRAEYYNGTAWTLNAADSCTLIDPATLQFGNVLPITGSLVFATPPSGVGVTQILDGVGSIKITPATIGVGSGDLTLPVPVWLKGTWTSTGTWNENPKVRLKFGSPKAPYIYLRERY